MFDAMNSPEHKSTHVVITVRPEKGRATTWGVKCSDPEHGIFPGKPKTKRQAAMVAFKHSNAEHENASVRIIDKN